MMDKKWVVLGGVGLLTLVGIGAALLLMVLIIMWQLGIFNS
jgi:hypothetical protein